MLMTSEANFSCCQVQLRTGKVMKMSVQSLVLFSLIFLLASVLINGMEVEDKIQDINVEDTDNPNTADQNIVLNYVEEIIENIEDLAAKAEKTIKQGILPKENTEKIYSKIEEAVEELVDFTNDTLNVYKFLNAKGIERTILPNIGINFAPLRRQLLLLVKSLFDVAPITTNAVIPIGVVDKVLDVFEHDDNLALKAHALDILYVWLPGNPSVQTRVMKMKGLEPFYHQIAKLDASVIAQLLDLFNKILEEHILARSKDKQRSKMDHDRLILYQRIGLIERLSTPTSCYGLLNILETAWSFKSYETLVTLPIFGVIKNIKPFCINVYKAKPKRTRLFQELLKFVDDPIKRSYLINSGLNITDTHVILTEFNNVLNDGSYKEEL